MGKLTDEQKIECVEKYNTGKYTCSSLGREYGIRATSMWRILKRRGVVINSDKSQLNRKYHVNEYYFDVIDTEEKAYFLGLMMADGSNYEPNHDISINLQERDVEILEKFNKAIESNRPLALKTYPNKKETWQDQRKLSVGSVHMSKALARLGCVQAKSLILKFPTEEQVPYYLIRHFIRGYNDGDGCISIGTLKNKRKIVIVNMVSTKMFLEDVKNIIKNEIGINCSIPDDKRSRLKNVPTRTLSVGGNNQAEKLLEWLYKDATIYLERKYKKYLEAKEIFSRQRILINSSKNNINIDYKYSSEK